MRPAGDASTTVAVGTRVAIRIRLLAPHERADGLPPDTALIPYDAVVRGTLERAAAVGEDASVRTGAGRVLGGTLETVEPADTHTFGRPAQPLVDMIEAINELREVPR